MTLGACFIFLVGIALALRDDRLACQQWGEQYEP